MRSFSQVGTLVLAGLALAACNGRIGDAQFACNPDLPTSCPPGWWCQVRAPSTEYRCYGAAGAFCGDGNVDPDEACDSKNLGGRTCRDVTSPGGGHYYAGTLACTPACDAIDTSQCATYCGDGIRNGPEVCDGNDEQMDEDTFLTLMRTFYEETRFSTYDTEGLIATVNEVTGQDFTSFFDEWVHQAGWPQLEYTWSYDATAGTITVDASQVQDATYGVYTLDGPLALTFVFDDADKATASCTVTVTMTGGATSGSASGACAYEPTTVSTPFTSTVLIELL